jgi:uncharacterized protein (DUF58 family)
MTPTSRLLKLSAALVALALVVAVWPGLGLLWKLCGALLLAVVLMDAYLGWRRPPLRLRREIRGGLPLGVWSQVSLRLENPRSTGLALRLHDFFPQNFESEQLPLVLWLPARREARLSYRLKPQRRGDALFPGADLVIDSPLGLWRRKHFFECRDRVKVFPNFREIAHYALLATDNRLSRMGVKRRLRQGDGGEFHQLREYRSGDSLRRIDWKASSRRHKLISKEYQDERDQQIVFLLDCGRRMRHEEGGRVHLDEALNAMLLLSYVAVRQGDAVGFLAFGGQRRWLPPRKTGDPVRELLYRTYDIESSPAAADYLAAARELMPLQSRRSLVVLLTNTRDEDHDELLAAVRLLRSRHLTVVADLREQLLDEVIEQPVRDFDAALRFHGVADYLESRRRNHELLRHHGALTLDLLAAELPVALVNRYLEIKASGGL